MTAVALLVNGPASQLAPEGWLWEVNSPLSSLSRCPRGGCSTGGRGPCVTAGNHQAGISRREPGMLQDTGTECGRRSRTLFLLTSPVPRAVTAKVPMGHSQHDADLA